MGEIHEKMAMISFGGRIFLEFFFCFTVYLICKYFSIVQQMTTDYVGIKASFFYVECEVSSTQVDKTFRNNLLAAGCASGIAAGFNAPIAGLFFALESVQMNYGPEESRARGPPMQLLAAVLAATVSQLGLGSSPAVDLDFFGWVPARSLWELPFFIILGFLCGLVAAALRSLRQLGSKFFAAAEEAGCPRYLFPIVAGILVAIVTFSDSTKEVLYKGFANVNLVLDYADGGKQPAFAGWGRKMIVFDYSILIGLQLEFSIDDSRTFAPSINRNHTDTNGDHAILFPFLKLLVFKANCNEHLHCSEEFCHKNKNSNKNTNESNYKNNAETGTRNRPQEAEEGQ